MKHHTYTYEQIGGNLVIRRDDGAECELNVLESQFALDGIAAGAPVSAYWEDQTQ